MQLVFSFIHLFVTFSANPYYFAVVVDTKIVKSKKHKSKVVKNKQYKSSKDNKKTT